MNRKYGDGAYARRALPTGLLLTLLLLTLPAAAQVSAPLGGSDRPAAAPTQTAPAQTSPTVASRRADAVEAPAAEVPSGYRLDVGDIIAVDVRRHEGVSRTVKIPADGNLRLPRLTRPIPVRGKTCGELAEVIAERLETEGKLRLRAGQVSVMVAEMRVRRIYVRGNAGRSGDYDLKPGWRVTELLAVIGSVPNPERVRARVLNPKRPAPLTLDLTRALSDPASADNVALQEGDTLTLELPKNKRFYVKGEGPRGVYELDERFGLRQALVQIGFTTTNSYGDLSHATLLRRSVAGDPNSEEIRIPVNLMTLMNDPEAEEIPLQDLDTLEVPLSQRFVYIWGQTSAPRKFFLNEDRDYTLLDILSLGETTGRAKIDDIKIWRRENGKPVQRSYKFGKFLANGDARQNPKIEPGDIVFVPDVKRGDPIGAVWTTWGIYGILQTLLPGVRP